MTRLEDEARHPYAEFVESEIRPALRMLMYSTEKDINIAMEIVIHRICTLMQDAETAERHRTEQRFMEGT